MRIGNDPRNTVISHFICPVCAIDIPLPRKRNRQRKMEHRKKIYCPKCNCKQNFYEYNYKNSYRNMDGELI